MLMKGRKFIITALGMLYWEVTKRKTTVKFGKRLCPVSIVVLKKFENNATEISVRYQSIHTGHDNKIGKGFFYQKTTRILQPKWV